MIRAVIWDLRCRNDSSGFVHNFIADKGIAYWNAGIVLRGVNNGFSLIIPVASTSNMFAGFIGADNVGGSLRIGYAPYSDTGEQNSDAYFMANYFRCKLHLSDTLPGLRFEKSAVDTKGYLNGDGAWCVDQFIALPPLDPVYKGTHCTGGFANINEMWLPEEGGGGGDGSGGFPGGGGGGGSGGNGGTLPDLGNNTKKPCIDEINKKANPLLHMLIQRSSANNIKGGTYGYTRTDKYGKKKLHGGIDFAADIGTPVYAMFSGTVSGVVNEQPNRIGKTTQYPVGYTGNKSDAGNNIYIKNGSDTMAYFHLEQGSIPFKNGDYINMGDVIGRVGITGNGNKGFAPHLHIQVATALGKTNPAPFVNGVMDLLTGKITTPCDK